MVKCIECEEKIKENEGINHNKKWYCNTCFYENYFYCDDCEEVYEIDESTEHEGLKYCEDCFSEAFGFCERCEATRDIDDLKVFEDSCYCEDCIERISRICNDCGERISTDDAIYSNCDDNYYCDDCYNNNFSCCDNCGYECWNDDIISTNNGYFCRDCYEENQPEFKESETFKINPFKRFVGVEMETEPEENNRFTISEAQIILNNDRNIKSQWKAKTDGSLNSGGIEFITSPLNGDLLFNELNKGCDIINHKIGYGVNARCGLHIHIDATGLKEQELKKVFVVFSVFEKELLKMCSPSRRNNNYCHLMSKNYHNIDANRREWRNGKDLYSRYKTINFDSLTKHNTIEIRLHQGTINSTKIKNWILINLSLFEWAKKSSLSRVLKIRSSTKTLYNIISEYIKEPKDLQDYIKERIKTFSKVSFTKKGQSVTDIIKPRFGNEYLTLRHFHERIKQRIEVTN